jgi:hypothetical protein
MDETNNTDYPQMWPGKRQCRMTCECGWESPWGSDSRISDASAELHIASAHRTPSLRFEVRFEVRK